MNKADVITLVFVVLVIGAIVLARRNGKRQFASALASARLEGYSAAKAEAVSSSTSSVHVGDSSAPDIGSLAAAVLEYLRGSSLDAIGGGLHDGRALSGPDRSVAGFGLGALQAPARPDPAASGNGRTAVVDRRVRGGRDYFQRASQEVTDADSD